MKRCLSMLLALAMVLSMVYAGPVGHAEAATTLSGVAASYAANLSIRTTRTVNLMSGPSATSSAKYTLPADTMLTVKALHKNTAGTYFYEVLYYDMPLYVEAAATTLEDHLTGDVSTQDLFTPAALGYRSGFPLGGKITATLNDLGTVTAAVHYSSNLHTAPAIISTDTVGGKSYDMSGSTLDYNLIFSDLAAGSYTFLLTVEAISYYIDDAGTLATSVQTVVLDNKPLVITNASAPNAVVAKGIDVSYYQGNINWASVSGQIDFAILRLGYATTMDSKFTSYAASCNSYGVPFGIYLYSYAENTTEALQEAQFVIDSLKKYDVSLPVFYDFEDECQASLSAATKSAIVKTFCDTVRDAGYDVGLYTFLSWFNASFTADYYSTMPKWVAQIDVSKCSYAKGLTAWQYSWTGSFSGISGDVDCDYWYGEFPGKNTDTSYLARCTYHPADLDATVNGAVNVRQYPSTDYSVTEELTQGTKVRITGLYKNTYGYYWYQIDRNGTTGYISAEYADITGFRYDDLSVIDPTMSDLALKSGYLLKGKLHSQYNQMHTVTAKVYSGEDTRSAPVLTSSDTVDSKKYTLNNSDVCDNLIFSDLQVGYYTYELSADVRNYYIKDGALTYEEENVVVWTAPFTVGGAAITPPENVVCDHAPVIQSAVAATCTAPGKTEGSYCSKCGMIFTQQTEIPATGHSYRTTTIAATCIDYEKLCYTCVSCNDSYTVYKHELTGQWSETKPEGVADDLLQTKTQYRYRDFDTHTSYAGTPAGYTEIRKTWEQDRTGSVHYVASWPSGYDTGHSLYGQYNNTKPTASETETAKTVLGNESLAGYIYYHWCRGTYTEGPMNRTTSPTKTDTYSAFHSFVASVETLDPTTLTSASDGSITFAHANCCTDSWWWYYTPVYAQDYTTYKALFTYEGWGDWSDWSDDPVTATDTRQVQTRTLYRSTGSGYGDHCFVDGICTLCGEADHCLHPSHDTDGICTGCGETVAHSFQDRVCTVCGRTLPLPTLTPVRPSVSFDDDIQINVYYTVTDLGDVQLEDMGLLVWNVGMSGGTIDDAPCIVPGASTDGVYYMVHTEGITAKDLGDTVYFKIYARLSDGSYVYSSMVSTSPKSYALGRIKNSTNDHLRALCVSLLDYGAAAQQYFGYKSYDLMNASLTEEQRALVAAYDESMVDPLPTVDASKAAKFPYTNGFTKRSPSVSFDSAFSINFYFAPSYEMDGEMTLYYWSPEVYNSVSQLSLSNATGSMVMEPSGNTGLYWGELENIAAKQIDQPGYFLGVYQSEGISYTTGILVYSLGRYCETIAAKESSAMKDLAAATAVYGYYAKEYFSNL